MAKPREGMFDARLRQYMFRRVRGNLWPPSRHNGWRLYNLLRCSRSVGKPKVKAQPYFVEIEATTACNLRCKFCLNPTLPNPRHRITYEQFVSILDNMPGLIAVSLLGLGEPTLNKDLFRMATEARRRKIFVLTVTNLNTSEKMVEKLAESDFNEVNISLESTDPERYAWFRTGGDLAVMEKNLQLLGELKRKNGKQDMSVGIWTTLTDETIPELDSIFAWCRSTGVVERVQFQFVSDMPMHLDIYDDAMTRQLVSNWQEAERGLRQLIWAGSEKYGILGSLLQSRCRYPWSGPYINAEGLMSPCCFIKDYHNPEWGSIAVDSLSTVWQSDDWLGVRQGLISGNLHHACRGCPYGFL
jgi:MoaA/NifB/PqqE/SkfB family radical SAM enzyme